MKRNDMEVHEGFVSLHRTSNKQVTVQLPKIPFYYISTEIYSKETVLWNKNGPSRTINDLISHTIFLTREKYRTWPTTGRTRFFSLVKKNRIAFVAAFIFELFEIYRNSFTSGYRRKASNRKYKEENSTERCFAQSVLALKDESDHVYFSHLKPTVGRPDESRLKFCLAGRMNTSQLTVWKER